MRLFKLELNECKEPLNPDTLEFYGSFFFKSDVELSEIEKHLAFDGEIMLEAIAWQVINLETITIINFNDYGNGLKGSIKSLKNDIRLKHITPEQAEREIIIKNIESSADLMVLEDCDNDPQWISELLGKNTEYHTTTDTVNWGASGFFTKVFAAVATRSLIELTKLIHKKGIDIRYHIKNYKIRFVKKFIHEQFGVNIETIWLDSFSEYGDEEKFVYRGVNDQYTVVMKGAKVVRSSSKSLRKII